jgi:DNA ligase (NAD+)
MEHFVGKDAMDIESLGPQRLGQLLQAGLIRNFVDIFKLQVDSLLPLPRMGKRSADRLLQAVEEAKKRPIWRLIHGLGIPHVGAETAKTLSARWPSMEAIMVLSVDDLQRCDGIGEIVAASIQKFFADGRGRELLSQLATCGVSMADGAVKESAAGPLAGKVFAITGTFGSIGRDALRRAIEAAGGTVRSAISKKVDALLVGDSPGSKLGEAEKLAIQTLGVDAVERWLADGEMGNLLP